MAQKDTGIATITHILGIFVGFWAPLIIYFVAKDDFSKTHAKEALNWQISLIIYSIIGGILIFVIIGIFVLIALAILNIIFSILAAIKASDAEEYRYPLTIRFLK